MVDGSHYCRLCCLPGPVPVAASARDIADKAYFAPSTFGETCRDGTLKMPWPEYVLPVFSLIAADAFASRQTYVPDHFRAPVSWKPDGNILKRSHRMPSRI